LFPPYTWHFDARATEDTRLVSFDGLCLRTKCEKDPAFGFELMKRFSRIMTQRIEALSYQLMDVYGDHA
jgi:CRP-like cAMP-binding protein